jgi:hypothetical protein
MQIKNDLYQTTTTTTATAAATTTTTLMPTIAQIKHSLTNKFPLLTLKSRERFSRYFT